jgi:hypothetical protein
VSSVPSFFNKVDFYGILLPGYLVISVSLLLFRPDILINQQPSSLSLLPTVVFVVAGPVSGLALLQTQRMVLGNLWGRRSQPKKKGYQDFISDYHHVRLNCSDAERVELEQAEAFYDFNLSSALGLTLLTIAFVSLRGFGSIVPVFMFLGDALLISTGYFQWKNYGHIVNQLVAKYPQE